jgi:hypothetical protein
VRRRVSCETCSASVDVTWLSRHVASSCRHAATRTLTLTPPKPKFWLDGSLRLRPLATLGRDASYYGVRTLRPRKSRRWEPEESL